MTEAVKALVAAVNAMDPVVPEPKSWVTLRAEARSVESESAREEAVEHAMARRVLLEIRGELAMFRAKHAEDTKDPYKNGQDLEAQLLSVSIDHKLSLLSARNYEVVEIPQGKNCTGCKISTTTVGDWVKACSLFWNGVNVHRVPMDAYIQESMGGVKRCRGCVDRYGVKEDHHG